MRRGRLLRTLIALTTVPVGVGITASSNVNAEDPVCGYVRYSTSTGPTSTVPYVPHCERPCGGIAVWQPPTGSQTVDVEALACVRPP